MDIEIYEKIGASDAMASAEAITVQESASPLKPSLITSFFYGGITHPKFQTIGHAYSWDIYALMASECDHWQRRWNTLSGPRGFSRKSYGEPTVVFLSQCTTHELRSLADAIHERVDGKLIQAISTFIPELSYNPLNRRASRARKALRNVLRIATYLRERGHNVLAVETTAGSRIRGLRMTVEGRFVAKLNDQQRSCNYLMRNLRRAVKANIKSDNTIPIALELEPGPYFLLRDWKTLSQLTELISRSKTLRACIGFNLDIGHWRLAGISPDIFARASCQAVIERVVYAHLSGHHRCAHFGESPPLVHSAEEEYKPWIDGLTELAVRPNSLYTGGLSLEIECVKNTDSLSLACAQFAKLIKQ